MIVTVQDFISAFVSLFPQSIDRALNLLCWGRFTGQIGQIYGIKGQ